MGLLWGLTMPNPAMIDVADAQEVVKHSAAAHACAVLPGHGNGSGEANA